MAIGEPMIILVALDELKAFDAVMAKVQDIEPIALPKIPQAKRKNAIVPLQIFRSVTRLDCRYAIVSFWVKEAERRKDKCATMKLIDDL